MATMTDIAQTNLREPEKADWDSFGKSSYQAPPPAVDSAGNQIVYFATPDTIAVSDPDDGYLNYVMDVKIVRAGAPVDGTKLRLWASTRPYTYVDASGDRVAKKGNPNKLADFLRACGVSAKPQTNAEYQAAVKASSGKTFPFVLDWVAKNKDTGEVVKGYLNFPDDPDRPGSKKSILKSGDLVTERDNKGNVIGSRTIQSDVLFANAQFRYFKDVTNKVTK
jgi:hypothetical protein